MPPHPSTLPGPGRNEWPVPGAAAPKDCTPRAYQAELVHMLAMAITKKDMAAVEPGCVIQEGGRVIYHSSALP